MKKLLLMLLSVITLSAFAQKTEIYIVHTIKVKSGQKMAFETAYKQHVAKFHKADKQKVNVYEILSGSNAGAYQIVSGPSSYADMDVERGDDLIHDVDLDKSFFSYLENNPSTLYYKAEDSLDFHGDVNAEKTVITIRKIKSGLGSDYYDELKKTFKLLSTLKGKFWDNLNLRSYSQLWDGSENIWAGVRTLKNGFSELEKDFYGPINDVNPSFKDSYIKKYGTLDWDKRLKLMDEAILSTDRFIRKKRKDMSSQ